MGALGTHLFQYFVTNPDSAFYNNLNLPFLLPVSPIQYAFCNAVLLLLRVYTVDTRCSTVTQLFIEMHVYTTKHTYVPVHTTPGVVSNE